MAERPREEIAFLYIGHPRNEGGKVGAEDHGAFDGGTQQVLIQWGAVPSGLGAEYCYLTRFGVEEFADQQPGVTFGGSLEIGGAEGAPPIQVIFELVRGQIRVHGVSEGYAYRFAFGSGLSCIAGQFVGEFRPLLRESVAHSPSSRSER